MSTPNYACTACLKSTKRDLLTVKKAQFYEMGEGGRTVRSRVVAWLCPNCTAKDSDWNRPKFNPPRVPETRTNYREDWMKFAEASNG